MKKPSLSTWKKWFNSLIVCVCLCFCVWNVVWNKRRKSQQPTFSSFLFLLFWIEIGTTTLLDFNLKIKTTTTTTTTTIENWYQNRMMMMMMMMILNFKKVKWNKPYHSTENIRMKNNNNTKHFRYINTHTHTHTQRANI